MPQGLTQGLAQVDFLTRSTFQLYNSMKSHANILDLFPYSIFDIQMSFCWVVPMPLVMVPTLQGCVGTKNS